MPTASKNVILGLILLLGACDATSQRIREPLPTAEARTKSVHAPEPPVAYWRFPGDPGRGAPIRSQDLDAVMVETSGRLAMQEVVLDKVLEHELDRRGIELDESATAREQQLLLVALDPMNEVRAMELLEEVRRREGLGPSRFAALLRRNAALRAMVQEDVLVRDQAVEAAWDARHGPRRTARVFVAGDISSCTNALEQIRDGASFADVAARGSMDPSASTGGLIDPVSRLDPSWPTAFRQTLWSLQVGDTSNPVLVDGSYLLVHFVSEEPGDGMDLATARVESELVVRRAQERLLMDKLASRLLQSAQVDILDSSFRRAWQNDP